MPKTELVSVRFDLKERADLTALATANGEGLSTFVRNAALAQMLKQTTGEAHNDNATYQAEVPGRATA